MPMLDEKYERLLRSRGWTSRFARFVQDEEGRMGRPVRLWLSPEGAWLTDDSVKPVALRIAVEQKRKANGAVPQDGRKSHFSEGERR